MSKKEDEKFEREMKNQRKEQGFSNQDVWSMNWWFLTIIPKMLKELRESTSSSPIQFLNDYYERHIKPLNICNDEEFWCSPKTEEAKRLFDRALKASLRRWKNVLKRMEQTFLDSVEDTCSYKNKYHDDYFKAFDEYIEKYGLWGNKIKSNPGLEHKKDGSTVHTFSKNPYLMEKLDEYKDIYRLYHTEQKKIDAYMEKSKQKALKMFVKFFDRLNY